MLDVLSAEEPIACQILIEIHQGPFLHAKLLERFAKARYMLFSYEINGIKHPSLEQEFIKIDRSRFDPLVKAFFQQQQKARQITMRQNLDSSHAAFHYLYNALMPEVNCPRLVRVGNTDDGGKWICDPWQLPDNCTVYSLGVGGDVTFEVELSNMTNLRCNTFSVDPDTKYASLVGTIPKVTFNAWRMAQVDKPAEKVRSIQGIMQEYGHRYIDILKIDIDNAEHEVMPDVLSAEEPIACQILIEIHQGPFLHAKLLERFAKARYMLFSYEINGYSIDACEYSFIHISCMQRYGISDTLFKLFNTARRR
uniref:Methyltransferase domain-containing protein n=1 Tax=Plectus sambesii TaxID=2011161 RepID=A0A914WX78_9BILA